MKSVAFLSVFAWSLAMVVTALFSIHLFATPSFANEMDWNKVPPTLQKVPWYDAERDEIRAIKIPPSKSPQPVASWSHEIDPDEPLTVNLSWLTTLVQVIGWTLLGICLSVIVVTIVRHLRQSRALSSTRNTTIAAELQIDALPQHIPRTKKGLWEEAQACYERGDLGWAIVFLYGYQLVELDRCGHLRLSKGKTNRQYVRDLVRTPPIQDLLWRTSRLSEAFYFGKHVPPIDQFHACWQEIEGFQAWTTSGQLQSLVKQV